MRFYGQGIPSVDQVLYESYFKDTTNGILIECGACDGVLESSCKFFEETLDWMCINIEPVPFLYEKLIENRPNSINIKTALSDKEGTATFTHAIHPVHGERFGNGSLKHTEFHMNLLKRQGCTFEEYEVEITTYDKMIKSLDVDEVDLFVLDVEGHEEEALKGMENSKVLPKIMCVEHNIITAEVLDGIMKNLGYKLDQRVLMNSYYIRG